MGLLRRFFRAIGLLPRRRFTPSSRRRLTPKVVVISTSRPVFVHPKQLRGRCWVVDGDSIYIERQSIRLAGIDAPELDHPYGKVAKSAMIRLCNDQVIRAEIHDSDVHGRLVATCYLPDGRDLAAELVKMGLAIDWPKFSGGKYRALEQPDVRKKLWRCDARQKGRFPPTTISP